MDFEEFNMKAEGLVAKIKEQRPIGIIRFGSSTRQEDYIPGVSDLDMVVVSKEPIKEISNEIGFEYFFNHPNQFVTDFANGNPFIMNAIFNGDVVYDPDGFVENVKSLSDRGLEVTPTKNTLYQIVQGIGNQLSSSINHYFSEEGNDGKVKLLRNAHSAVRGIGIMHVLVSSGELPEGYNSILSKLEFSNPELAQFLKSTRNYLVNHSEVSPEKFDQVLIGEDSLGSAIKASEKAYVANAPLINIRVPTNELIEGYQSQVGKLNRTLAVRINNGEFNHLVLGNQQGKNYVFGLVETNSQQPKMIGQDISEEQFQQLYPQLKILR
ncbi:hypothetical protein KAJ87_02920 [Candidatus Pacearchaeota archaeon]|nr:hypothetical protein [Candidatus Pacearchaeota archaeon]